MCCLVGIFGMLGPRAGILVWWLISPERWQHAFSVFWWPLLGALFAPWTTLAYVLVYTGGVHGWEWALIVVGALCDASTLGGGSRGSRNRSRARHHGVR